jgi:hypothetical protein
MRVSVAFGGFPTAEQVMYRSKKPSTAAKLALQVFRRLQNRSTKYEIVFTSHARATEFPRTAIAHVPQHNPRRVGNLHVAVNRDHLGQNLAHRGQ